MSFTPLKRLLPRAVQQAGLEVSVSATRVVDEAQKLLALRWEPEQVAHVEVASLRDGVLTVAVSSPAAAHALHAIQIEWMNDVNRSLGERKIREVRMKTKGY